MRAAEQWEEKGWYQMRRHWRYSGIAFGLIAALLTGCSADSKESIAMQDQIYADEAMPADATASGENYQEITENAFCDTVQQPVSTFSADVDTASYSNLRRMIRWGYRMADIPADAVRVEELVNYFSYDYRLPEGDEPFGVTMQVAECPWNTEHQLLSIGLKSQEIDFTEAKPSNLVFLLDVSGSMQDADKLPLLQQAFTMLSENLTAKDRISIVTYAGSDAVLLEGCPGDQSTVISAALSDLQASGSTNGSAGIETAYALAEKFYLEDGNNRVILATDGDLNVGVTSEHALSELISRKKESGVYLTALGFGTGNLQDNKLETLADDGNGMYAYIDSVTEARKVLVEELGANMVTVAEDVKLQATFSPAQVAQYRLIGYENRLLSQEDFEDDTKDAGEIGAGHTVTALYELVLTDQALAPENADAWMTLDVRYKKPHAKTSQLLEYQLLASDYTDFPSEDFQFASCVAQFGMIVRNSAYCGGSVLQDVRERLNAMGEQTDVYRAEFCDLVNTLEE